MLSSGSCVAACREEAAHSAYDMFSKYKYLNGNLGFPISVFSSPEPLGSQGELIGWS